MRRRVHRFFLAVGGAVVQCRYVIKEKSPAFRSPEVCIASILTYNRTLKDQFKTWWKLSTDLLRPFELIEKARLTPEKQISVILALSNSTSRSLFHKFAC